MAISEGEPNVREAATRVARGGRARLERAARRVASASAGSGAVVGAVAHAASSVAIGSAGRPGRARKTSCTQTRSVPDPTRTFSSPLVPSAMTLPCR